MIVRWRQWTRPSDAISDPTVRWRARLLASLMLVGAPVAALVSILLFEVGLPNRGLAPWMRMIPLLSIIGAYILARSPYWQVGAWLVVLTTGGLSLVDLVLRAEPYFAVFVALSIILGGMVLRPRDVLRLVIFALIGILTAPWWSKMTLSAEQQVLLTGFFVALGIILRMSIGMRQTLERRRLAKVAQGEARFRGLLEVAFEGLIELKDGRIVELNHGFLEITGRRASELRGRELSNFLSIEERSSVEKSGGVMLTPPSIRIGTKEASGQRPNGDVFYVEFVSRLITTERGPIEYVAIRDVTERRKAEFQLSVAHRAVALGTLCAGIAHEINNPLSWMMTNLQVAHDELRRGGQRGQRAFENESVSALLDEVLQGGRRVMSIVHDLKTMSREGGDQGDADVHAALDLACRVASQQIDARARLVRDYGDIRNVRGSADRLGQVFLNLLINAVQAIPEGNRDVHRITLRTRQRNDEVEVCIRDTGRGIPRSVLPHVFDPFYTTKSNNEGTGLGLSITRSVVDSMGGTLVVQSREGDGATFTLRFPVAQPSFEPAALSDAASHKAIPPTTVEKPRELALASVDSIRVLIIDDEPLLGRSLRRALSEYDVVFTADPNRALELCRGSDFDVIVCDLMMPELTGEDIYKQLRTRTPGLASRMIFMTGGAYTVTTERFLSRVDNPVLSKPFAPDELRRVVQQLLGKHAA